MPPKKIALKAGEESTSAGGRPGRKLVTKAIAPKSKANKATAKPSAADNAVVVDKTTKPPASKAQKKAAPAQPATSPASKSKTAHLDRPRLAGEEPPSKEKLKKAASKNATPSATTPQQRANTSKKRTSSALEEEETQGEEEVEPVATKSAKKKTKTEPGTPGKKRKATVDSNTRPKKAARSEEAEVAEGSEEKVDKLVDSSDPKLNKDASRPARSKAGTPKPPVSEAAAAASPTPRGRGRRKESKAQADKKTLAPEAKKDKKAPVPKGKTATDAKLQLGARISFAPTNPLDIFVFGAGESGELGLGNQRIDGKKPVNVKHPRLHPLLSAEAVGVVEIACGGMHSVALTKDNRILTWGVNDQGALGRNTEWDGGLRDADADDDDNGDGFKDLNPLECTPAEVSTRHIGNGTKFAKVAASDSASFALTEDGRLYGWGTFRSSDGILGFSKDVLVQHEPKLLPESKNIIDVAAGNNHVMTLDSKGKVETWGAPEMNQLGRRVVQRDMKASALRPGGVLFKRGIKIVKIACGSYHSFAIDDLGRLYAWGLNNYGELGLDENVGEDAASVLEPTLVGSLEDYGGIAEVAGGEHHSIACTEDGKLLVWGRIDGKQTGLTADKFNHNNTVFDDHDKPRILTVPTVHEGFPFVRSVACGTDNSFAITQDGKAYSWGFSAGYQTGQGEQDDDVEVPTLIDNSAVRGREIFSAAAGGQFSVLTSIHRDA